jgi:flagellar biogenesis protein FliO
VEALRQIAALVFVFGLLGLALWWLRGKKMIAFGAARKGNSKLQIVDRIRLTPQHSIHVVRIGKRDLVIAVHGSGCTLLETLPAGEIDNG